MILAGFLSALGLLFLIFKFGVRRIITYDIPIDIAVTGFLMYAFAGTYSGMLAAMIGGLIVSQVLTLYTTPVIYLLLDKLHRRWSERRVTGKTPAPLRAR